MSESMRRYTIVQVERLSDLNLWCRDEDVADIEAKLEAIRRDRDELWCRTLLEIEDFHILEQVLMTPNECGHLERPRYAKGMCRQCYRKDLRAKEKKEDE